MRCLLCFNSDGKLQRFRRDGDNDIFEKITFAFPELSIPEAKDPVFICPTCLEEISSCYTIKMAGFNATVKEENNLEFKEFKIDISSNELATKHEHVEIKVEPNQEDQFLSKEIKSTHVIKEEKVDDDNSQQLETDGLNLNEVKDDESSCTNNVITQNDKNLSSYEFVDINKVTEKDSNLSVGEELKQSLDKKRRFKCNDCDKAFTSRKDLVRHSRVHTGERPYNCQTCQKSFTRSSHLTRHKVIHTGEKPHECDVCRKTFTYKNNLETHKRSHSNVRPYQCAVCSQSFVTSAHLNRHMLTHTGEKPHQCHVCEYKCTQASVLKTHMRTHTGEKPYICNLCKKSFTQSGSLKDHKRRFHNNRDIN